ncbi:MULTISPECIES: B12-binding domain-containing radical SAM protein [Methanobacterium]|nr:MULTISPECIES: radical SAM protein [Methanobacterium]
MNDAEVLLINPMDKGHVTNGLGLRVPPLNLMYLAAALEKASLSVKILDDDLYQVGFEKIASLASKIDPVVVGVTATTATIKNALKYVKAIKEILPNTLAVIGGSHPTFTPSGTLKAGDGLDVVVVGEGEETLTEVAEEYIKNGFNNFENVKGIVYRDNGKINATPPRPLIENLDGLSFPARHLVPFNEYKTSQSQAGGIITSRGCVFNCNYCSSSLIMGKKFRSRSAENVVDELEELVYKYGVRDIAFLDDIFMLNKRRARAVADEIKNRGLDISFVTSSRVDTVNQELLECLKSAGMSTLYCGIESGSQRVLDLMGKGITLKQSEDAIKAAKNVDINVLGSFMLGYPGETAQEMDQTIDFSIKLDPDYGQFSILTPFPGTPIYYELKQKGLLDTEDWSKYTVLDSVVNYEKLGLTKKLVERKLNKAYLKFYTRPKYLFKHRSMFKVLIGTLFKSYVIPKLNGGTPEGWYNSLQEEYS